MWQRLGPRTQNINRTKLLLLNGLNSVSNVGLELCHHRPLHVVLGTRWSRVICEDAPM